jgi:hypothetical protein
MSNFCFDTFFAVAVNLLCSLLPNIKLLFGEIVVVDINLPKMLQLDSAIEIIIASSENFLYIIYFFFDNECKLLKQKKIIASNDDLTLFFKSQIMIKWVQ